MMEDQNDDGFWPTDFSKPRDPYLRWAERTDYRSLGPDGASHLSFIVERSDLVSWDTFREKFRSAGVKVPRAYDDGLPSDGLPPKTGPLSKFATLRLPVVNGTPVNQRIQALLSFEGTKRLQLGHPRAYDEKEDSVPGLQIEVHPATVVVGIIDDGCPFAHPDLLDSRGETRIELLWQQTLIDEPSPPWKAVRGFGYGRMLDRSAMTKLMRKSAICGQVDEALCYFEAFATGPEDGVRRPNRLMLARESHGGSVMAVAAGRPSGLQQQLWDEGPEHAYLYGTKDDAAALCPLIFVDLPREQVEISSGRWISVSGLDAIRFILREARDRFKSRGTDTPVPVVINLSSGSTAGAHVGQAMFERAMDELLAADQHLAITLAAGNSRTAGTHEQVDVPGGGSKELGVFVPPLKVFDTFVEFWLPEGLGPDQVTLEVHTADGKEMTVGLNRPKEGQEIAGGLNRWEDFALDEANEITAALLFYPEVVQATNRTMILLAVSGTVPGSRHQTVSVPGPWRVKVHNAGNNPLSVEAWIERDEIVYGMRRDQAARFFPVGDDWDTEERKGRRDANTMSNISTGKHVFAVGALRGADQGGVVAKYSGRPGLEAEDKYLPFAAKADDGESHPGVRVPGNRGNVMRRLNGTSVAAPQAARYVANEMAKGRTRVQVRNGLPSEPAHGLGHQARNAEKGEVKKDPADGRLRLPPPQVTAR